MVEPCIQDPVEALLFVTYHVYIYLPDYRVEVFTKVKLFLCTPWKHIMGVEVYLHLFLTSALDGGEWSASRAGRFTPGEMALGAP